MGSLVWALALECRRGGYRKVSWGKASNQQKTLVRTSVAGAVPRHLGGGVCPQQWYARKAEKVYRQQRHGPPNTCLTEVFVFPEIIGCVWMGSFLPSSFFNRAWHTLLVMRNGAIFSACDNKWLSKLQSLETDHFIPLDSSLSLYFPSFQSVRSFWSPGRMKRTSAPTCNSSTNALFMT